MAIIRTIPKQKNKAPHPLLAAIQDRELKKFLVKRRNKKQTA